MTLEETMQKIRPVDAAAMAAAKQHWDGLGKPLGSLGRLEKALIQIAGIQRTGDVHIDQKALVIMCADNGVVEEGVTQCGQEVTATVAENFLDEKSCVAIMCRRAGTKICPVDIGMAVDTPRVEKRKIAYGTKNMAKEPAMTREQAVAAIEVGIAKAEELHAQGYEMLATGEMGIGNTTTSSAMTAVYLGLDVETVTGRGAGLSSHGLQRKIHAIKQAIAVNQPDPEDPRRCVGKSRRTGYCRNVRSVSWRCCTADAGGNGWIYFPGGGSDSDETGTGMCGLYSGIPCFRGAGRKYFTEGIRERCISHLWDETRRGKRSSGTVPDP